MRWITAFIDLPASSLDADIEFWLAVTGTTLSASRGVDGEFVSLLPGDGHEFLKVQRLGSGPARLHLDVHVDDPLAAVAPAVDGGGTHLGSPNDVAVGLVGGNGADRIRVLTVSGNLLEPRGSGWEDTGIAADLLATQR